MVLVLADAHGTEEMLLLWHRVAQRHGGAVGSGACFRSVVDVTSRYMWVRIPVPLVLAFGFRSHPESKAKWKLPLVPDFAYV